MSDIVYTRQYFINSILVRPNNKLGLVGLLGILQDMAVSHAKAQGFGYEQMLRVQTFWVLARQTLLMNRWPKWEETISVKTWARPLQGSRAYRDFEVYLKGELIGQCSTYWVILDGKSRRPKSPGFSLDGIAREDYSLDFLPAKVESFSNGEDLKTFEVRNSDLDMNLHMNNTKYAQWISDSIPFERHNDGIIKRYDINFLAETHLGDVVAVRYAPREDERLSEEIGEGHFDLRFQGLRERDSKIVFASRILAQSISDD